jgi:hypothetical protein
MKNKNVTYMLVIAVVVLWGVIIYRIAAAYSEDDYPPLTAPAARKMTRGDFAVKPDTARLLLNYRDPFGLMRKTDTVKPHNTAKSMAAAAHPAPASIDWSFVKYAGFIANPGSKKIISLLTVNGVNVMLAEGEQAAGIKLIRNKRDSVMIGYKNKFKFIKRNTGTL